MKRPSMFNLGTALLSGTCAVLGALLVFEILPSLQSSDSTRPAQPPKKPQPVQTARDDFNLPPLQEFRDIIDRPLFVQSRRPVQADPNASKVAGQPDASLNQLSLNAVIVSANQRIALFRNTVDKKTVKVEEGKPLQGWTLKEVLPESVTLTREGQEQKFVLVRKTPDAAQLQALRAQAQARKAQQARARAITPAPATGVAPGQQQQRPGMPLQRRPGAPIPPNVPAVPPGVGSPPAAVPPPVAPEPPPQAVNSMY